MPTNLLCLWVLVFVRNASVADDLQECRELAEDLDLLDSNSIRRETQLLEQGLDTVQYFLNILLGLGLVAVERQ